MRKAQTSLIVLTGCIPTPRHVPAEFGTRGPIEKQSLAFLDIGRTTRKDVLLHLGEPDAVVRAWESGSEESFLYSWKSVGGYWTVFAMDYAASGYITTRSHALRITFNEAALLVDWKIEERRDFTCSDPILPFMCDAK
jgi:hypothetical protein